MKICQNIDEMVPSGLMKSIFFQMESFWNVLETVTKVSKENGFHGNLVTKQNKCNNNDHISASNWSFPKFFHGQDP